MLLNFRVAPRAVLGVQLQLGLEISGLVGHVYPVCVCMYVCVFG